MKKFIHKFTTIFANSFLILCILALMISLFLVSCSNVESSPRNIHSDIVYYDLEKSSVEDIVKEIDSLFNSYQTDTLGKYIESFKCPGLIGVLMDSDEYNYYKNQILNLYTSNVTQEFIDNMIDKIEIKDRICNITISNRSNIFSLDNTTDTKYFVSKVVVYINNADKLNQIYDALSKYKTSIDFNNNIISIELPDDTTVLDMLELAFTDDLLDIQGGN